MVDPEAWASISRVTSVGMAAGIPRNPMSMMNTFFPPRSICSFRYLTSSPLVSRVAIMAMVLLILRLPSFFVNPFLMIS